MKSKLLVALVLLLCGAASKAQAQITIYGTWQAGSAQMGEGIMENYVFKVDNTFEYQTDSDDGLRRVIALGGTYALKGSKLELVVTYTKELVGGTLERSTVTKGNDSWSIEGGEVQRKTLPKPVTQVVNVHFNSGGVMAIEENRFFRMK